MQLSYEKNSTHLSVFNRKFWFCLNKVTELPDLTVFTLQMDPRLRNFDNIHI